MNLYILILVFMKAFYGSGFCFDTSWMLDLQCSATLCLCAFRLIYQDSWNEWNRLTEGLAALFDSVPGHEWHTPLFLSAQVMQIYSMLTSITLAQCQYGRANAMSLSEHNIHNNHLSYKGWPVRMKLHSFCIRFDLFLWSEFKAHLEMKQELEGEHVFAW